MCFGADEFLLCFGLEKGPLWRGDRRPKGTPLVMGFTMALVFDGGLGRDAGGGNGREDTAGLFCSGLGRTIHHNFPGSDSATGGDRLPNSVRCGVAN
jgi:hypothetical protein